MKNGKKVSPYREKFGGDASPSPLNIVDRKKKKFYYGLDDNWVDPMGVEEARKNKLNTIEVDKKSNNIIDKHLLKGYSTSTLIGKKVWCISKDKKKTYAGWVVNVFPARVLLIRNGVGERLPMTFESVIAMKGD